MIATATAMERLSILVLPPLSLFELPQLTSSRPIKPSKTKNPRNFDDLIAKGGRQPVELDCRFERAVRTSAPVHEPTFDSAARRSSGSLVSVLAAGIFYRGRKSTFRDAMLVPQLVFLPRARIAGSAATFSSCWTMKAS